jgi:hypothetical protein
MTNSPQFFYDGQIRRYLLQIIRLLSNFVVKQGDGTLIRVPVMYGDIDRQVATIINQNSEASLAVAPRIAVYIGELALDRNRLGDASHVGKVHIRERDIVSGEYIGEQGNNYTVERLMPTPYTLSVKADIWASSNDQKLQLLEQILMLFNPSLEIQTSDNYLDWTSLSVVDLDNISYTSRTVPVGTATGQIDIASLGLITPIWLSPPAKVKRLGITTNIITSIFDTISDASGNYIDGLGNDPNAGIRLPVNRIGEIITTIGDYDIEVVGLVVRAYSKTSAGFASWEYLINQYPGNHGTSNVRIELVQLNGTSVVGYGSVDASDATRLLISEWDQATYPVNTLIPSDSRASGSLGSFDAIVDPTAARIVPSVGSRYLIVDTIGGGMRETFASEFVEQVILTGVDYARVNDHRLLVDGVLVGSSGVDRDGQFVIVADVPIAIGSVIKYEIYVNESGPVAWKNSDATDFIAEPNDLIEWSGTHWSVVFSADESADVLVYQTNLHTLAQYKWDGVSWSRSFEGAYARGYWRLIL